MLKDNNKKPTELLSVDQPRCCLDRVADVLWQQKQARNSLDFI